MKYGQCGRGKALPSLSQGTAESIISTWYMLRGVKGHRRRDGRITSRTPEKLLPIRRVIKHISFDISASLLTLKCTEHRV